MDESDAVPAVRPLPAPAARSVWRHRDLRLAVTGRSVSVLGDEVAMIALVIHAYDAGWGTFGVAALFAASTLPIAIGMPIAGRFVDRVDSRRNTVTAAVVQAVAAVGLVAVLALAPASAPASVVALLVLLFGMTLAQAVASPSWNALLPRLVAEGEASRAVSASHAAQGLAFVAGPGLGGLLAGRFGPATALALDAVTFVLLVGAALAVRTVRRPDAGPDRPDVWAGLRLLFGDRLLRPMLGGVLAILVVIQVVLVVEVFLVRTVFGAGAELYGGVGLVLAVGSLLGATAAGRLTDTVAQAWGIVGSLATISLLTLAAGRAPALVWVALAFAGIGFGFGALNVAVGSLVVSRTPDAVRGRVYSAVAGTTQIATVAGLGLAAAVGRATDPRTAYVVSGLAGLAVTAGAGAVAVRALAGSDREASPRRGGAAGAV